MAAIKITRHNLLRPTAVIHEAGHQVAHIAGWNEELAAALSQGLSEASADSPGVVGLVVRNRRRRGRLRSHRLCERRGAARCARGNPVFQAHTRRSTPDLLPPRAARRRDVPPFLRRRPWDDLALVDTASTRPSGRRPNAPAARRFTAGLETVVRVTLDTPMRAFQAAAPRAGAAGARQPGALSRETRCIGPALFTSSHWLWTESLRILALTGLQLATRPRDADILKLQEQSMLRLGGALQAA